MAECLFSCITKYGKYLSLRNVATTEVCPNTPRSVDAHYGCGEDGPLKCGRERVQEETRRIGRPQQTGLTTHFFFFPENNIKKYITYAIKRLSSIMCVCVCVWKGCCNRQDEKCAQVFLMPIFAYHSLRDWSTIFHLWCTWSYSNLTSFPYHTIFGLCLTTT